ncbi:MULTISPECIES: helix-turn-helix domain-containing protein [Salinibaculum]|uniref:helix-turn-helix domain-containing protein n=1 Tax=Salinibaculum TaxID=2732368 RepID=UPI0030D0FCA2
MSVEEDTPSLSSIDTSRTTLEHGAEPWKDDGLLRRLYVENGLTVAECAEVLGCSPSTISRWLRQFGIETRDDIVAAQESGRCVSVTTARDDGKRLYHVPDGDSGRIRFYEHQLVALLAENVDGEYIFSTSDIFADETVVHHEAGAPHPIDVPENMAVISATVHSIIHAAGGIFLEEKLAEIFEEYDGEPPIDIEEWERLVNEVDDLEEGDEDLARRVADESGAAAD